MKKNLIIFCDDQEGGEYLLKDLAKHLKEKGLDYEAQWCASMETLEQITRHHGDSICCFLLDELPSTGKLRDGSELAAKIREGYYGEALKTLPVAIVTGGSLKVLDAVPPIYLISKEDVISSRLKNGNVQQFIQTGIPSNPITEQHARNYNATVLTTILNSNQNGKVDLVRALQSTEQQVRSVAEGISLMDELVTEAFTNGKPDKKELDNLHAALSTRRLYIENDEWAMRFSRTIEKITSAVTAARGLQR